ncbi:hypothetical protein BKA70DRAFT_1480199 [Coprinopsis sp. MPI-PUGE-AT-0042]|nr:hypothetical protein BKA70DRAFT_1480199 [Coprinopsis sp. MPI-PUGE-AT-0042]
MDSKAEALGQALTEAEIQFKVIYLVAIWVEALLYGLYFCLFMGAITIVAQKEAHKPFASKVFLGGNILIFIAISFHNSLNLYRFVIGFAYQPDARAPLLYLNDLGHWTGLASPFILVIILWTGDALVRNYRVLTIPSLLYILIVGLQISNLWWISQQSSMVDVTAKRWPILPTTFPLYFAQNVLTTGLCQKNRPGREELTGGIEKNTRRSW